MMNLINVLTTKKIGKPMKKAKTPVEEIDNIFAELANEAAVEESTETPVIVEATLTVNEKTTEENDEVTAEDEAEAANYFNPQLSGEPAVKTPKAPKVSTPKTPLIKIEDTTGLLTKYIKKAINQSIIWTAINEEYRTNESALKTLSDIYPELYANAAKYFKKCPENNLIHSSVKELINS